MEVKIDELRDLCEEKAVGFGLTPEQAQIVVDVYMFGELSGKKSHGLIGFPSLKKKAQHKQEWTIVEDDDAYALIDGQESMGNLVAKFAMDLAVKKAKAKGIALVGMYNMHPFMMPGYCARLAANEDMIGIVFDNSRSRVAPHGGIDPRLGTNPIGLAIPSEDFPLAIDMATSTRAFREVGLAKELNEIMPEGIAIDAEGNPTEDPDKFHALTNLGYKGYGLGLAIEMLAGSLVRAKMGSKIEKGLDRGFLFIVIDPEIFVPIDAFKKEVSEFFKEVKSSRKAPETEEILIPGERATREYEACLKRGTVEIAEEVWEKLQKL